MNNLDTLIVRLETMFLDPYKLALPESLKLEAFRASLAELNSILGSSFLIEGLDTATVTTLPDDHLPALLRGAAATVIEAVSFHSDSSYSNLPKAQPDLIAWARYLRQERDQLLDRLRLSALARPGAPAWGSWKLEEVESHD